MTDDDREGFELENDSQAGDPTAAFEALRRTVKKQGGQIGAEMTIIRRGVEAAFDQFEKYRQPPDYGPDLSKIIKFLAVVDERLEAVEQSPILYNGPEHYARALERSGESLVKTAAQQLEGKGRDLEREAQNLAAYTKSAYDRRSQDLRMWFAGGIGLLAGTLLVLLLPRILPFAADTHVAAIVMGQDRWNAGVAIMETVNPRDWQVLQTGGWLYQNNRKIIDECFSKMTENSGEQNCTINIP